MELLNVVTARSVWLFDINELNPNGKDIFPEVLDWLKEQYHFEKAPKSVTDVDESKALAFSQGTFQIREEIFVAVELKIFNDGVIANSWSSTRDSEAFLSDALGSAAKEFSLTYKPDLVGRRLYLSEMNVRCAKQLAGINPRLLEFAQRLRALYPTKRDIQFEPSGIMVAPVQDITPTGIAPFKFERKINTSPEEQKYYSSGPLHTDDHLTLLTEFESLLSG